MTEILNLETSTGALLVGQILRKATSMRASDVHLERGGGSAVLRFRHNGVLCPDGELEKAVQMHYQGVISRLKVMAGLDLAQRRLPQDGRMRWQQGDVSVDVRLSLVPALSGERAVLRLIYGGNEIIDLDSLGMSADALSQFRAALSRTEGLLLVTGPTGSGKSTTLYAAMQFVNSPQTCVLSVEDPIERVIAGVGQVQVQAGIGLDFSRVLRAFLRQDPEVLVVGEMRDRETAEIAVRASLTGHLVMSTLHAGSCLASIARLRDMGLDGWLLGASLRLVIAQRLVRQLCPQCAVADPVGTRFALEQGWIQQGQQLKSSRGCDACNGTGYGGRGGIFECLPIGAELADAMVQGSSDADLRRAAGPFDSLRDIGLRLLAEGSLSLAEFRRVLG